MNAANPYLIAGAAMSAMAALAHLGCIIFGASWYRFFGAGEKMASMAEAGLWYPTVATLLITGMLASWSLYALSGAGVIRDLPFPRLALCAITLVYFVRGIAFVWLIPVFPGNSMTFWLVSSGICMAIGMTHLVGLLQIWTRFQE